MKMWLWLEKDTEPCSFSPSTDGPLKTLQCRGASPTSAAAPSVPPNMLTSTAALAGKQRHRFTEDGSKGSSVHSMGSASAVGVGDGEKV